MLQSTKFRILHIRGSSCPITVSLFVKQMELVVQRLVADVFFCALPCGCSDMSLGHNRHALVQGAT
uniref:Uncharacterized protein n=1 Tax=Schistosoma mansoni TaxID=6183 RepID=A0A5K4F8W5_SCHMA